ncbi:MAG: mucoidy inhibitor MuiA family protein [Deinococcota bacterium]
MFSPRQRRYIRVLVALSIIFMTLSFAQEEAAITDSNVLSLPGEVVSVTLYRGQAQVSREIVLEAGTGLQEIVVSDLPNALLPGSLFAESPDDVEVRAVRYRERVIERAPDETIAALQDSIQGFERELAANRNEQALTREQREYLNDLVQFVSGRASNDMANGALDAEVLERLTLFSFDQRQTLSEQQFDLEQHEQVILHDIERTLRELEQLRAEQPGNELAREALVFIDKRAPGPARILLSYLVTNSSWTPAYNMRADSETGLVNVEYNAIIQQLSGEDWSGVNLTLSTATPTLSAARPVIGPFEVALSNQPQDQVLGTLPLEPAIVAGFTDLDQAEADGIARTQAASEVGPPAPAGLPAPAPSQFGTMMMLQQEAQSRLGQATNLRDKLDSSFVLNTSANALELFEVTTDGDLADEPAPEPEQNLMLSYTLDNTVSVASRRDQQLVRIAESDLTGEFYFVATPVLTPLIYREVELANDSDTAFLAGSVSAYLDGRFVGQSELVTIARGQPFTLGFGADPQLRANRRLTNRDDDVRGGNQVIELAYDLSIENFSDQSVPLRLYDRLPISDDDAALNIELLDTSEPLSEDALYVQVERPEGLLRWDTTLEPNLAGSEALRVQYSYLLEFDRSFSLTTPDSGALQLNFREFQQERQLR